MSIRVIAFDAVHTLIHPMADAIGVYESYAKKYLPDLQIGTIGQHFKIAYGVEEYSDRDNHWRTDENREFQRWRKIVHRTMPGLPNDAWDELYQHFAKPNSWTILPEVNDVLCHLRERYRLVVASNFDARLHNALLCDGLLADSISQVFISAEMGIRKPAVEFYHIMCHDLQCRADQVMMVGDDLINDFVGASAAGLASILYDPHCRYADQSPRITTLTELVELMPIYDADHP